MEIDAEVAIPHFSPLSIDSAYGALSDGGVCDSPGMVAINMMDQTSPPTAQTHVYPSLYSAQKRSLSDPNFLIQQGYTVNSNPGVPYYMDESIDLDTIEMLLNSSEPLTAADLGPPPMPVRLTRLDEEPPKHKVLYDKRVLR